MILRRLLIALVCAAALAGPARAQVQGSGVGQSGSVTANNGACWASAGVIKDCGGAPGLGNVVGPASAVSGNIATFSGTTGKIIQDSGVSATSIPASSLTMSQITASLGADVPLNNTGTYFDGPSIAQGVTGTWFVSGTVTLTADIGTNAGFLCKLWDGTTVIASTVQFSTATTTASAALSGYLASPAGNLRISCRDPSGTAGSIVFNASGNSKDSTISAFRIR